MILRAVSAIFVFLFVVPFGSAAGQNAQAIEQFYTNAARKVIANVRSMVRPHLTAEEKRIEARIVAKVVSSGNFNAVARKEEGQRDIVFTNTFVMSLDSLARSYVAENEFGAEGCFKEYAEYFLKGLDENTRRAQQNRKLKGFAYFDLYVKESNGSCSSLSPEDLVRDPTYGRLIAGIMDATLAVLTLHEVAHHVLGHVERNDAPIDEIRRMEREADLWAFDRALKIRINPLAAGPTWMIFAAMDGADLAAEARSTHPLGIRRYLDLLRAVERANQDGSYAKTFGSPLPPRVLSEVRDTIRKISAQLN